ncbi:hypothetical protein [Campylobacter concisus]|uniref:hypothetical protein n=1 Tax=Campylobacter concisus TaxID=199 RepID=UPI00122D0ED4|nr:hypothetical protein [Campylobacter concisus]
MKFENFYKNVKTSKYFDKDSFIGQIVLNGIWYDTYKCEVKIPRELFAGIVSILDVFIMHSTQELIFEKKSIKKPYLSLEFDPKERLEVISSYIFGIYDGDIRSVDFDYIEDL